MPYIDPVDQAIRAKALNPQIDPQNMLAENIAKGTQAFVTAYQDGQKRRLEAMKLEQEAARYKQQQENEITKSMIGQGYIPTTSQPETMIADGEQIPGAGQQSVSADLTGATRMGRVFSGQPVAPVTVGGLQFTRRQPTPKESAELRKIEAEARLAEAKARKPGGGEDSLSDLIKSERLDKLQREKTEAERQKSPIGRVEKLSAEGKEKLGKIVNAWQSFQGVKAAHSSGYRPDYVDANTFVLGRAMSDTPLTAYSRELNESVGRLQSGGAITKEELANFRSLGPRPGDSEQIQAQKLQQQEDFLRIKMSAFGLRPEDLGSAGFDLPQPRIPKTKAQERIEYLRAKKQGLTN